MFYYIFPSLLIESSLGLGTWVVKKSAYGLYCGIYYIMYGKEETTEEKLNKLIEKEKRQDQLLIEAIDKMNIQELELSRLNNKLKDDNDNNKESIDDYVVIL